MEPSGLFGALFEPRAVAFIGASKNPGKWGFNILHHLVRGGFEGAVYPVNPRGGDWYGLPVYQHLDLVPDPVDLAVIVVPVDLVPDVLVQCGKKHIPAAVVITAGYAETGPEGRVRERHLLSVAREQGIRLMGPNTMGHFSAWPSPLQACMTSMSFIPGPVGIISQSGNLGAAIAYRLVRRNLGISRLVSSGNEGDLCAEDYLAMLADDPRTRVICLYIEGLRRGREFFSLARAIVPRKPVICIKGGRSDAGARAAQSHTAAIAGDDAVFAAMCTQAGIIAVDTMDEMADVAGLLLGQPRPAGDRVGIITLGGGWGVVATDMCHARGLTVPALSTPSLQRLDAVLPPYWSRGNPVDLVAPATMDTISDAVKILLETDGLDSLLFLGLGYMTQRARRMLDSPVVPAADMAPGAEAIIRAEEELIARLARLIHSHDRPLLPVIDQWAFDLPLDEHNPVRVLDEQGIMSYSGPAPAIRALARTVAFARHLANRE